MMKMLQTWTWQLWELKAWLLKRPPHHLTLILGFTFFLIRGMLSYAVIFCHAPLWIAPRPLTEPLAASYKLLALQDVRFFVAGNNLVEPRRDLPKDLALIVLNPLQSSRRVSLLNASYFPAGEKTLIQKCNNEGFLLAVDEKLMRYLSANFISNSICIHFAACRAKDEQRQRWNLSIPNGIRRLFIRAGHRR